MTITPPEGRGVWLTRAEAREAEERWGWKWGRSGISGMRRGKVDVHVVGMECTTFQELPNPG